MYTSTPHLWHNTNRFIASSTQSHSLAFYFGANSSWRGVISVRKCFVEYFHTSGPQTGSSFVRRPSAWFPWRHRLSSSRSNRHHHHHHHQILPKASIKRASSPLDRVTHSHLTHALRSHSTHYTQLEMSYCSIYINTTNVITAAYATYCIDYKCTKI